MATKKIADKKLETGEKKSKDDEAEDATQETIEIGKLSEEDLEKLRNEMEEEFATEEEEELDAKDKIVKGKGSKPVEVPEEEEHKTVKSTLEPKEPRKNKNAFTNITIEVPEEYNSRKNTTRAMKFGRVTKRNSLITINKEGPEKNQLSAVQEAQMDMIASFKKGIPLTGIMTGIEPRHTAAGIVLTAVLKYGPDGIYKIVIPSSYFHIIPEEKKQYEYKYLESRMGSQVSFVVDQIDKDEKTAIGNRLMAMENQRRTWWFGKLRETGEYRFREGILSEANVTSVQEKSIFAEILGVETIIPLNELTYNRISDAKNMLRAGDKIKVRIKKIERNNETKEVKALVSLKAAKENPKIQAFGRYQVGGVYRGQVTWIYVGDRVKPRAAEEAKVLNGIFVSLDNSMECLCPLGDLPPDINPKTGDFVTVKITRSNEELLQLDGKILRVEHNYKY